MAAKLPLTILKFSLLFLFTTFAFLPSTTSATSPKPHRITTKLHHSNSLYYHKTSPLERSLARLTYLEVKARGGIPRYSVVNDDDIRAGVVAEASATQFMANFSIGDPPVAQLLTMDTGSNLLWVQCLPCAKCFNQTSPIFDPSRSSSYNNLSCWDPSCVSVFGNIDKCDASNNCKFSHKYLDDTQATFTSPNSLLPHIQICSIVAGLLGTETLTFETPDEGTISVPHVLFGCAHDNDGYNGEPSGILGLGPSNISLVTQLGSKFSYCIGNIRDPNYNHNVLTFGSGADLEGDLTPLRVFNGLYFLNLVKICVGDKELQIDPRVFKRTPQGKGGVVIDSGTTLSFLVQEGYGPLSDEVKRLLDGNLERVNDGVDPLLCYKGMIGRDLTGFPAVTFEFAGGAELSLDIYSLFEENGKEEFCLALHESEELSIMGVMAQQNYNIGFDVSAMKISFQRIDCELLEQK